MEREDPARCAEFRLRAARFSEDFIYWFADDGAALPFGRSLAYRFGQAAFWSAAAFAGAGPYGPGVVKGLLARHFAYWMKQPIFDRDGVLTVGYGYPDLLMAERYNAPGSPYWGMKSFLVLALPEDHPFWAAPVEPLPELAAQKCLARADMLLARRPGDVTAYVPGVCELYGHGHVPEKYAKFAYSTHFGFSVARSRDVLHEACPDSMLAFVPDGDDTVYVRKKSQAFTVDGTAVTSRWSPLPGVRVTTVVTPNETGHTRRHTVESSVPCTVYDCGFAVRKHCLGFAAQAEAGAAWVKNGGEGCRVTGRGPAAKGQLVGADPNTSLLWPNTEIPAMCYRAEPGVTELFTTVETWIKPAQGKE